MSSSSSDSRHNKFNEVHFSSAYSNDWKATRVQKYWVQYESRHTIKNKTNGFPSEISREGSSILQTKQVSQRNMALRIAMEN